MLKVARNAKEAVQEMNSAFSGDMETTDYSVNFDKNNRMRVRKVYQKKQESRGASQQFDRLRSAIPKKLEPIEELVERDDSQALVPMTYQ